ncbi:hypothetical protein D3C84_695520 [compost metagenome]
MRSSTGDMMKKDMKRAMPISTWLDGLCCRPMACLRIPSTTMIRVKEVIMMTMAGRKESAVISASTCRVRLYS